MRKNKFPIAERETTWIILLDRIHRDLARRGRRLDRSRKIRWRRILGRGPSYNLVPTVGTAVILLVFRLGIIGNRLHGLGVVGRQIDGLGGIPETVHVDRI